MSDRGATDPTEVMSVADPAPTEALSIVDPAPTEMLATVDPTPTGEVVVADPTPVGGIRVARRRHPWRRRVVLTLVAMIVIGGGYYGITLYQVHSTGQSDQARPVDAIVVMGAAQYDGTPSPQLQARLDHALDLWKQDLTDVVIVTGGKLPADRFTEAQASRRYLVDRGVPVEAIELEDTSRNTYDAFVGVADLLPEGSSVLIVTDPYHSLRSRLTAEELGLEASVSPTRTSPVQGNTARAKEMKEALGVALGRIIGFRRLLSLTG